ncbi:MAG: hypothetical protein ABL999_18215 [Pyrinomonadaceae bacterium]
MDFSEPLSDRKSEDITVRMDHAQRATILAALLYYQEQGFGEPENRPIHIHNCATALDQEISLDEKGISELFQCVASAH